MKLRHLIKKIRDENKIPTDELFDVLTEAIYKFSEEECKEIYKELYQKAFGERLTKDIAEEWVHSLDITDDSSRDSGQKWTMEQTTDVGNKIGIDWNVISKTDWYIALNMEYSKHYKTAKQFGAENDAIFFASLARDEWYNQEKTMFNYYFEYVL